MGDARAVRALVAKRWRKRGRWYCFVSRRKMRTGLRRLARRSIDAAAWPWTRNDKPRCSAHISTSPPTAELESEA